MTAVRGDDGRSHVIPGATLPVLKSWGRQAVLRCLDADGVDCEYPSAGRRPIAVASRATSDPVTFTPTVEVGVLAAGPPRKRRTGGDGAYEAVRAKLMCHIRQAAERVPLFSGVSAGAGVLDRDVEAAAPPAAKERTGGEKAADAQRPWNLRARTAVRRVVRFGFEPESGECASLLSKPQPGAERGRSPFALTLSSREITEDIFAMTGSLPRRRPAKRPRAVQRQLDALLPGSSLTEITADSYRVPL